MMTTVVQGRTPAVRVSSDGALAVWDARTDGACPWVVVFGPGTGNRLPEDSVTDWGRLRFPDQGPHGSLESTIRDLRGVVRNLQNTVTGLAGELRRERRRTEGLRISVGLLTRAADWSRKTGDLFDGQAPSLGGEGGAARRPG